MTFSAYTFNAAGLTPGRNARVQDVTRELQAIAAAFATISGQLPAGADTNVLFNDGGLVGGNAKFTFDKATGAVNIDGPLTVTGLFTGAGMTLSGNASVGGTLGATGNVTFGGTLAVTGATTLSTATITGNGTVGGSLNVTGTATANTMSCGSLAVVGGGLINGSLTVNVNFECFNATITGKATSAATTSGDGSTTLTTKGYVDGEIDGHGHSTGSTIDGDGTTGSPLDVADGSLSLAKLNSALAALINPAFFGGWLRDLGPSLAGAGTITVFNDIDFVDVSGGGFSATSGVVTVPAIGHWRITAVVNADISTPSGDATLRLIQDPSTTRTVIGEVVIDSGTNGYVNITIDRMVDIPALTSGNDEFAVELQQPTGATTTIQSWSTFNFQWVNPT